MGSGLIHKRTFQIAFAYNNKFRILGKALLINNQYSLFK